MAKYELAMCVCGVFLLAASVAAMAAEGTPSLQPLLDGLKEGDILSIEDGVYDGGLTMSRSGSEKAPITIRAAGSGCIIRGGKRDGLTVEGASWVIVEGIRFENAGRAGLSVMAEADKPAEHVTVRDCVFADNGVWGLVTSHQNRFTVEGCEAFGSGEQHGIYIANSGEYAVVRNNRIHHNNMCGLHMNGDPECGGDGVISHALVEGNVIWENGKNGGSAINCTHVQDSVYRNNLCFNNYAGGMVYYFDTGGEACHSRRNEVYNNTVYFRPDEGRWSLYLLKGSTDFTVRNNVFAGGKYGVINVEPSSLQGLTIDNNVYATHAGQILIGNASEADPEFVKAYAERGIVAGGEGKLEIEPDSWRVKGYDAHSQFGMMPKFADIASGAFGLAADSAGVDQGEALGDKVPTDIEGTARPQGAGWDCGCFERKAQ